VRITDRDMVVVFFVPALCAALRVCTAVRLCCTPEKSCCEWKNERGLRQHAAPSIQSRYVKS
jgi:hypothetical protein